MPRYDAQCPACGAKAEYVATVKDVAKDRPKCQPCGKRMKRIFSAAGGSFVLKGKGWFKSGGY